MAVYGEAVSCFHGYIPTSLPIVWHHHYQYVRDIHIEITNSRVSDIWIGFPVPSILLWGKVRLEGEEKFKNKERSDCKTRLVWRGNDDGIFLEISQKYCSPHTEEMHALEELMANTEEGVRNNRNVKNIQIKGNNSQCTISKSACSIENASNSYWRHVLVTSRVAFAVRLHLHSFSICRQPPSWETR